MNFTSKNTFGSWDGISQKNCLPTLFIKLSHQTARCLVFCLFVLLSAVISADAATFSITEISDNSSDGSRIATDFLTFDVPSDSEAAELSLSGQVKDASGRGISRALVTLTDLNGASRRTVTNQFGRFQFKNIRAGVMYVLLAEHKVYTFAPRVFSTSGNLKNLDLIPNEELLKF
ncbi:MAG: carboxypeptidase-like regulatory domain-containing protein [Pyrinomonadaceae bacterium]